jgi:hypothetical protein
MRQDHLLLIWCSLKSWDKAQLESLDNSQALRKLATKEQRAGTKVTVPDITRERFKTKLEQLLLVATGNEAKE